MHAHTCGGGVEVYLLRSGFESLEISLFGFKSLQKKILTERLFDSFQITYGIQLFQSASVGRIKLT